MKSTFQLVSQMNTAFGNPKGKFLKSAKTAPKRKSAPRSKEKA